MDLLLINFVALAWLSLLAARRWFAHPAEQLLAAATLGWANLIATGLALSLFRCFGESDYVILTSTLFALLTWSVARRCTPPPPEPEADNHPISGGLLLALTGSIALCAAILVLSASSFPPANPEVVRHDLPRALLHVGQGSILPLTSNDPNLVLPPFNFGLLQAWILSYQPALESIGILNCLAWCVLGTAVFRLSRMGGATTPGALVATWFALVLPPAIALASSANAGLCVVSALLAAIVFGIGGWRNGHRAPLIFAGLLVGLAAGSHFAVWILAIPGFTVLLFRARSRSSGSTLAALAASLLGVLPFLLGILLHPEFGWRNLFVLQVADFHPARHPSLETLAPLWRTQGVLASPTENEVGVGFVGWACIAAALATVFRPRLTTAAIRALAAASLILFCGLFGLSAWRVVSPGAWLLATCLAIPALASLIGSPGHWLKRSVLVSLGVAALWSVGLYFWTNAYRPLGLLLQSSKSPSLQSQLPVLLDHRLKGERRINFSVGEVDRLLFAQMQRTRSQRFVTQPGLDPSAYNVISRASDARHRLLSQLSLGGSYVVLAFPNKPSAGVELLGSVGLGAAARDYFGISGAADRHDPIPSNRNILITITARRTESDVHYALDLKGLNPRDRAVLQLASENIARQRTTLASVDANGIRDLVLPRDIYRLQLRLLSLDDGRELGAAAFVTEDESLPAEPADASRLFGAEFISNDSPEHVSVSAGLTPPEGPFPQWDLPLVRWSRTPAVTLRIPATEGLSRIRLRLSAKLHMRPAAILEVLCNHQIVRRVEFTNPVAWHEESVEFAALPGENVVELRDAPLPPEPDWAGYLTRYPDVRRYLEQMQKPLKEGAIEHHTLSGRREGRQMDFTTPPTPAADAYFFLFRRLRIDGLRQ